MIALWFVAGAVVGLCLGIGTGIRMARMIFRQVIAYELFPGSSLAAERIWSSAFGVPLAQAREEIDAFRAKG